MDADPTTDVLSETLAAFVPLFIAELAAMEPEQREQRRRIWAADGARTVGSFGDALMFVGGKSGRAAKAFDALVRGLAAAAFQPGGITAFGNHWEATCAPTTPGTSGPATPKAAPGAVDPSRRRSQTLRAVQTIALPL